MSKVLLVEDDNNLREIYEARLAAEGYDIITAQNGEEALVVAKQNKPDLIISDVMMPRISGFEMLDILRNTDELRDTKVIMLTALGQAEDQVRAGKLGADKYLVKSQVTLEDIVNTAKELLGELAPATAAPAPTSTESATTTDTPAAAGPVAVEQPVAPAPLPPEEPELTPTPPPTPPVDAVPNPVASPQPVASVTPTLDSSSAATSVPVVDPDPIVPVLQPLATSPVVPAPDPVVAQTTAAEEATVDSQIESFANTTPESQATVPVVVVAPDASGTVAPVSISAANDKVLTAAMDDLVEATSAPAEAAVPPSQKQVPTAPSPEPTVQAQPVVAPSPAAMTPAPETPEVVAAEPNNELQAVAGKKVIQPINDLSSPGQNLDALLAQEEAKEQVSGTVPPVVNGVPAATAPAPGLGTDPNSIAL